MQKNTKTKFYNYFPAFTSNNKNTQKHQTQRNLNSNNPPKINSIQETKDHQKAQKTALNSRKNSKFFRLMIREAGAKSAPSSPQRNSADRLHAQLCRGAHSSAGAIQHNISTIHSRPKHP
jgi:hypothetical protein